MIDALLLLLTFALGASGAGVLLLWAIPGLTVYGALAYAVMLATIGLGVLAVAAL